MKLWRDRIVTIVLSVLFAAALYYMIFWLLALIIVIGTTLVAKEFFSPTIYERSDDGHK